MTATEIACALARKYEGIKDGDTRKPGLQPYRDPVGYWTIGYGHLITKDKDAPMPDMTWTMEDAERNLVCHVEEIQAAVRRRIIGLTDGQEAALIDFTFNLGLGSLLSSTLLRKARRGDLAGAGNEFPKWKFAGGRVWPGLVLRRAEEQHYWRAAA